MACGAVVSARCLRDLSELRHVGKVFVDVIDGNLGGLGFRSPRMVTDDIVKSGSDFINLAR